jgi:hypothetical protein
LIDNSELNDTIIAHIDSTVDALRYKSSEPAIREKLQFRLTGIWSDMLAFASLAILNEVKLKEKQ